MHPPDVDFLVPPHPAQSLSVDTTMRDGTACRRCSHLAPGVPMRYRMIHLTVFMSPSVGSFIFLAASFTANA
eukprot:9115906-Heterocapsa_arctica.AAC.1